MHLAYPLHRSGNFPRSSAGPKTTRSNKMAKSLEMTDGSATLLVVQPIPSPMWEHESGGDGLER